MTDFVEVEKPDDVGRRAFQRDAATDACGRDSPLIHHIGQFVDWLPRAGIVGTGIQIRLEFECRRSLRLVPLVQHV